MVEEEFDQMLEDIESANDEFVNDYFNNMNELVFDDDELVKKEKKEETPEEESTPTEEESVAEEKEEVEEKEESTDNEETSEEIKDEEEPEEKPVFKNRFTSFSKTNLNKTCSKKIKVYHDNDYEKEEEKEVIEEPKEEPKKFSYSEILNRLDQEKKYDLNNVNDLMKFIEKCDTADEFFNYVESEANDK